MTQLRALASALHDTCITDAERCNRQRAPHEPARRVRHLYSPAFRLRVSEVDRKDFASLAGQNVIRGQMNAICANRKSHVGAGVEEKCSSRFPVPGSQANGANCLARENLQFTSGKVLFAQLDVVHATGGGLGDLFQQEPATSDFIAEELFAIGDVVQKQV